MGYMPSHYKRGLYLHISKKTPVSLMFYNFDRRDGEIRVYQIFMNEFHALLSVMSCKLFVLASDVEI